MNTLLGVESRTDYGRRLNLDALDECREKGLGPNYDPRKLKITAVSLGFGNLASGLIAKLFDQANCNGSSMGLCAVGFNREGRNLAAKEQDGLFSLGIVSEDSVQSRIIGSVPKWLFAKTQAEEVLEVMTSPDVDIVFVSVKRAGYYLDTEGGLDMVKITNLGCMKGSPRTAVGFIYEALMRRKEKGIEPFRVVACDNIFNSGGLLEKCLHDYSGDSPETVWIKENVRVSSSVVDRICRADDAAGLALLKTHGIQDRLPMLCEENRAWTIQGSPIGHLARAGVRFVDDPREYSRFEKMKYLLVNGGHFVTAVLGSLMKFTHIHHLMSEEEYRTFVLRYLEEVSKGINFPKGIENTEYLKNIISRFSKSNFPDPINRVGTDAPYKVSSYLIRGIQRCLNREKPIKFQATALALWIKAENQIADFKENDGRSPEWALDEKVSERTVSICRALYGARADYERLEDVLWDGRDLFRFRDTHIRPPERLVKELFHALNDLENSG